MLSCRSSLPIASPSKGAGAKAAALGGGRKSRRRSLPLLHSLLHLLLFLLSALEAGVQRLPLPPHTTVLTDGSDKLSWPVMSVGGYCCRSGQKQSGGKKGGGQGGGVWRGRHKRESRLGEELRLAFSLCLSLRTAASASAGFKTAAVGTLGASASFLQERRSAQVCSARPVSGTMAFVRLTRQGCKKFLWSCLRGGCSFLFVFFWSANTHRFLTLDNSTFESVGFLFVQQVHLHTSHYSQHARQAASFIPASTPPPPLPRR